MGLSGTVHPGPDSRLVEVASIDCERRSPATGRYPYYLVDKLVIFGRACWSELDHELLSPPDQSSIFMSIPVDRRPSLLAAVAGASSASQPEAAARRRREALVSRLAHFRSFLGTVWALTASPLEHLPGHSRVTHSRNQQGHARTQEDTTAGEFEYRGTLEETTGYQRTLHSGRSGV